MGSGAVDSSQWLSVKEETIFLHDGLIRVTDLAELPSEIGVSEQGDTEQEVGESHRTHSTIQRVGYWDCCCTHGVFLLRRKIVISVTTRTYLVIR